MNSDELASNSPIQNIKELWIAFVLIVYNCV